MPARMIRAALLTSDRYLGLPDNTSRVCYVAAMLNADDRGNLESSLGQLVRMWRDYGIDSNQKAASIANYLADHDLVRQYEVDGKHYMHIPRFGQRLRHLNRACPLSPWCDRKENQSLNSENDGRPSDARPTTVRRTSAEVKRSEVKRSEEKKKRNTLSPLCGEFERFWAAYPRKKNRIAALKAWAKLKPDEHLTAKIHEAVVRAKASADWQGEVRFIPHPATWLNAGGWDDEEVKVIPKQRGAVV